MELSEAFDTIDHAILLNELSYYGIGCDESNWFQATYQIVRNM